MYIYKSIHQTLIFKWGTNMKAKTENKYLLPDVTKYLFVIFISLLIFSGIGSAATYVVNDNSNSLNYTSQTYWKFESKTAVTTSPIYQDENIYFQDRYSVYSLNSSDGTLNWDSSYSDESGMIYHDGKLFSANHTLNASSGNLEWDAGYYSNYEYKPTIYEEVIYLGGDKLTALDANTHSLRWDYDVKTASSPFASNGCVYFSSTNGTVYSLNSDTGHLIWKKHTDLGIESSPVVYNNTLYISAQDKVCAINATSGTFKWNTTFSGPVTASPNVVNDTICVGSEDGYIYAINSTNSELNWKYQTNSSITSSSAIKDGLVFTGATDGYVYSNYLENGTLKWKYRTGSEIESKPCPESGIVYVSSTDKYLYAIGGNGSINDTDNPYYYGDRFTLNKEEVLNLNEGYNLSIDAVDVAGAKTIINVSKQGEVLDKRVISSNEHYYYNRSLDERQQTILKLKVDEVFQGQVDSLAQIEKLEHYPDLGYNDTENNKFVIMGEEWELENGYSLKLTDITKYGKYCYLSLIKNGTVVDQEILDDDNIYRYQRLNTTSEKMEKVLEIDRIKTFSGPDIKLIELPPNYTINNDKNTINVNDTKITSSGSRCFADEYTLKVNDLSTDGKRACISLFMNDTIVDRDIVGEDDTYTYERLNVSDDNIITVLSINTTKIFDGINNDYVVFKSNHYVNPNFEFDDQTIDLNQSLMISSGDSFNLSAGYRLKLKDISRYNPSARLHLYRNDTIVDEDIIHPNSKYEYKMYNATNDCVCNVIIANISEIYSGKLKSYVVFESDYENYEDCGDYGIVGSKILEKDAGWNLYSGYNLTPLQIDVHGEKAWLEYTKQSNYIDDKILVINDTLNHNFTDNENSNSKVILNATMTGVYYDPLNSSFIKFDNYRIVNYSNVFQMEMQDTDILSEKDVFSLDEYNLSAAYINSSNKSALLRLRLNNSIVKESKVTVGSTFQYNTIINSNHYLLYKLNVLDILQGSNSDLLQFSNLTVFKIESISSNSVDLEGPSLNLHYPEENQTYYTSTIEVNGTSEDESGVSEVSVNGLKAEGTKKWNIDLSLPNGKNTINVTSMDHNGNTNSKSIQINIEELKSANEDTDSSGGSSGGGGGGATGEEFENIASKHAQVNKVAAGEDVRYDFNEDSNAIMAIQFKSLTNEGQTKTSIEVLKDTSALVDSPAPGKVYQNLNIWVGNVAFDEDDMEDPVVGFRVSKEWISENDVEPESIVLCRYHDGEWTSLTTEAVDENENHFIYESETPGFSPFAISSISMEKDVISNDIPTSEGSNDESVGETDGDESTQESESTPGFSSLLSITILITMLFIIRQRGAE